jgi:hypothetical protein
MSVSSSITRTENFLNLRPFTTPIQQYYQENDEIYVNIERALNTAKAKRQLIL